MNTKLFRIGSISLLLVCATALALSQQPAQSTADAAADRLRVDVTYLASDELAGRRTGTPGATLASDYLAKQFSRIGLRRSIGYDTPGMSRFEADSPKRYQQEFPYVSGVQLGAGNLISTRLKDNAERTIELQPGLDWMPLGFSLNGAVDSPEGIFV